MSNVTALENNAAAAVALARKEQLTALSATSLIDLIVVAKSLPQDEIEQLEAFTDNEFDVEELAVQIHTGGGMKWTSRVIETGEPIFVAGLFQVGTSIWRTFMLPGEKAFSDLYAGETTRHVAEVLQKLAEGDPFVRLETVCLESRKVVREWYPKIGLTYESTMPNYGANGENAVMYTKFGDGVQLSEPKNIIERI